MGGGEKPIKNKELRKPKQLKPKAYQLKIRPNRTELGPRERLAQDIRNTESIRIPTKRKSVSMMVLGTHSIRMEDGQIPLCFLGAKYHHTSTPLYLS